MHPSWPGSFEELLSFHVSRPVPAEAMTRLLAERRAVATVEPEPYPFRVVHGYAT